MADSVRGAVGRLRDLLSRHATEVMHLDGSVATLMACPRLANDDSHVAFSGGQFEELVDELNLTPNVSPANPPSLPFPNHVHRLISLEAFALPPGTLEILAWP
jgi:hypothetical protein